MIYIAADMKGFETIQYVASYLSEKDLLFTNIGAVSSTDESIGLLDFVPIVAKQIKDDLENTTAIISCGTGVGVEVGANKFGHIRACLATEPKIANWAVTYDKCNVLCLPGWEMTQDNIEKILDAWFEAKYDGSKKRLNMFETFMGWNKDSF